MNTISGRNRISYRASATSLLALFTFGLGPSATAEDHKATIITFDVPGAVSGTFPAAINPAGTIAGNFGDADQVFHGFLRAPDGTITTFDPPGAVNTFAPIGIDPAGVFAGSYTDANGNGHGFLRDKNGSFTTFDVPGALTGTTTVSAINSSGTTTGIWFDANFVDHGFLRASNGAFTTFDFPGSIDCANLSFIFNIYMAEASGSRTSLQLTISVS